MFVRGEDGKAGEGEEVMEVGVWFDEDYLHNGGLRLLVGFDIEVVVLVVAVG